MIAAFWEWYERHYRLNLTVAAGLFALQLLHLYWLTAHIVVLRLVGVSYFDVSPLWQLLLVLVDYAEVPTLMGVSVFYLHELRKRWRWKHVWYLFFLNSQWLHIFWITDEVVAEMFVGAAVVGLPLWLAWLALTIDYLELPVIFDTMSRLFKLWRNTPSKMISVFSNRER